MTYKKINKDSYGFEVPIELSFDEYWSSQERIEKLSTEESYRQRDERLKCCDSAQCWNEPGNLTWSKPYRFLNLEGLPSSKRIELQVSAAEK